MPNIFETTDAAAGTSTAYQLQIGQVAQGRISANGDHDWYRVDLVAGQTYTFALVGTGSSGVRDSFLQLYGPGGGLITSNDDGLPNNNSIITFTATTTGAHYIDAGAFNNAGTGQYGISVALGTRATTDVQMGAGIIDVYNANTNFEYAWNATPGTPATVSVGFRVTNDGAEPNFSQFTAQQVAAVQTILQYYSDVCGISFTLAGYTDSATILLSNYNNSDGSGGYAYYPGSTAFGAVEGDIHINIAGGNSTSSLPWGSYSFSTLLHEMGHALGLSHPGLYNAGPGQTITYNTHAQFTQDTHQYTVMSYFDESNTTGGWGSYAETLMMYDIYALQQIYGVNTSTRSSNSVYGFNSNVGGVYDFSVNGTPALCIWDGGGTDTLDCSGFGGTQLINLNDGAFSNVGGLTANVSIALNAVIENAYGGTGNDTIIGNENNNVFRGGGGTDTMNGGAGRDSVVFSFASTSASIVHNANGSWTISGPGQTATVTNIELAEFTDRSVALREPTRQDLNGDGTSDIILRNGGGTISAMTIQNGINTGWNVLATAANWSVVGTGDFGGDGTNDILLQNAGGIISQMRMQDGAVASWTTLATAPGWSVIDTGDFNRDGTSDILLQNGTGLVSTMLVSNGAITSWNVLATAPGWTAMDSGDFNGDGTTDILLQNAAGLLSEMLIQNGAVTNWNVVATAPGWSIADTGDFNGDGTTDILLRDSSGVISELLMQNGAVASWNVVATVPGWTIGGTADVNSDGTSDILLQNAGGTVSEMLMQNGAVASWNGVAVATGWVLTG